MRALPLLLLAACAARPPRPIEGAPVTEPAEAQPAETLYAIGSGILVSSFALDMGSDHIENPTACAVARAHADIGYAVGFDLLTASTGDGHLSAFRLDVCGCDLPALPAVKDAERIGRAVDAVVAVLTPKVATAGKVSCEGRVVLLAELARLKAFRPSLVAGLAEGGQCSWDVPSVDVSPLSCVEVPTFDTSAPNVDVQMDGAL